MAGSKFTPRNGLPGIGVGILFAGKAMIFRGEKGLFFQTMWLLCWVGFAIVTPMGFIYLFPAMRNKGEEVMGWLIGIALVIGLLFVLRYFTHG